MPTLLAQLGLASAQATHDSDEYDAYIRAVYHC